MNGQPIPKPKKKAKKRKGLNAQGKSPVSRVKRAIQAKLRENAIKRDGGCIMRHYANSGVCAGVLQADHLVTRANSASYAEMNNIVCLCLRHHFYFKKQHPVIFWANVQHHIGDQRWAQVQYWERDKMTHRMTLWDWEQALKNLDLNHE